VAAGLFSLFASLFGPLPFLEGLTVFDYLGVCFASSSFTILTFVPF